MARIPYPSPNPNLNPNSNPTSTPKESLQPGPWLALTLCPYVFV